MDLCLPVLAFVMSGLMRLSWRPVFDVFSLSSVESAGPPQAVRFSCSRSLPTERLPLPGEVSGESPVDGGHLVKFGTLLLLLHS